MSIESMEERTLQVHGGAARTPQAAQASAEWVIHPQLSPRQLNGTIPPISVPSDTCNVKKDDHWSQVKRSRQGE